MNEATKSPSTLSEISHLFLSSLRDTNAAPKRTPPPSSRAAASIDLTPEELDKVSQVDAPALAAPVTAVLASHLDDARIGVGAYAQHLAAHNQRVGIIEIGRHKLRLSCLANGTNQPAEEETAAYFEPRHLAEAMEELNADIDRWLLVIKNPKSPQAQNVLRLVRHWLLITTCDSEGIVAGYRSIKALSPIARPRLGVALLDPAAEQIDRVYQKISGVCEQFLHWPIERGPALRSTVPPVIHTIMLWNLPSESAEQAPHWQTIEGFLSRAAGPDTEISPEERQEIAAPPPKIVAKEQPVPNVDQHAKTETSERAPLSIAAIGHSAKHDEGTPVLSLNNMAPESVMDAVLRHHQDLIACPVPIPMCESGRLTVGRDHKLLLLAVAGKGLADLRAISYAYRWVCENRQLVAMAVPQLAIDAQAQPKLRLLIDHADRDAQTLAPILQNPLVEIHPFRKLNWSGKLGLLLEAA